MDLLSRVALFEDFDANQLRLLAFGSDHVTLTAGSELYLQDQESDCGYVMVNGLVDLTFSDRHGETVLASIGAGGLIGELALVSDNARPTGAIARRDSQLIRIPRALFRRMLEEYPDSAYRLHQKISRSMRQLVQQLQKVRLRLDENQWPDEAGG